MSDRIMKTIGVIGGGAAGLCSARHILATSEMTPIVWEQSTKVGGTWIYTQELGKDKHGLPIHSSMYESLKTNLPKEIMAFPDYPFPEEEESFIHHTKVCKYLESYADHFKLDSYIKFNHHVEKVSPVMRKDGPPAWDVTVKDLVTKTATTTTCDALLVCNGHYSVPNIPDIKDIVKFKGSKLHSHDYREPSPYEGSTVLVLGASASGLDICVEVSTVAKKVFLAHNFPITFPSEFPPNVQQVRGAVAASENGFTLADGSFVEADAIVYCTGYEFSFPFLSEECGITVEDNVVVPLYKHLIHSTYPSMAFIGIPFLVCPFQLFDSQVQHFIATLTGKIILPSSDKMAFFTKDEMKKREGQGCQNKHYHRIGIRKQAEYSEEIAKEIGCPPPHPYFLKIALITMVRLVLDFPKLKEYMFKITEDGKSFIELHNGEVVNTKLDLTWLCMKKASQILWHDFFRVTRLAGGILFAKIKEWF